LRAPELECWKSSVRLKFNHILRFYSLMTWLFSYIVSNLNISVDRILKLYSHTGYSTYFNIPKWMKHPVVEILSILSSQQSITDSSTHKISLIFFVKQWSETEVSRIILKRLAIFVHPQWWTFDQQWCFEIQRNSVITNSVIKNSRL
jgi:hypothetical protein